VNLASLEQTFRANRGPILGVAAAGVAGLALLRRKRAGGNTAAPLSPGASYSAGAQIAGTTGGVYDSSASDVYGVVGPQLEALSKQLNAVASAKPKPAPTPVPKTTVPKVNPGYYQVAGGTTVYYVSASGARDWITPTEGKALFPTTASKKKITQVAVDNGLWKKTTLVGKDSAKAKTYWVGGDPKKGSK
jgi:hypothetical protein